MPFMLKKILAALLLPLPIAVLLLTLALIAFIVRAKRLGVSCSVASLLLLLAFSTSPLPRYLLHSLEANNQPLNIKQVDTGIQFIVVLGAGNGGTHLYPANMRLSSASLARLIESIRLYHQLPQAKLILSGGRVFGYAADAKLMNNTAIMLGVNAQRMLIEAGSRDTYQEAVNLKKLIGKAPFILVTSAYHMPRSLALFKGQGMHPIAAPTQYLIYPRHHSPARYLPNTINLVYSDIAIHEYLGMLWAWLNKHL